VIRRACSDHRLVALLAALALGACAAAPARQAEVPLPPAAIGAADPGRGAVLSAAYVFEDPSRIAGRPAEAARAAARLEWMAETLPGDPRWRSARADLFPALAQSRDAVRRELGIRPAAPPDAVASALIAAAQPLDRGARGEAEAALRPVSGDPAATVARLAALPQVPRAAFATSLAAQQMNRLGQTDDVE
jgi:hypothetical protein